MLITLDNLRQTLQAVKNKLDSITSRVSTVESSVNTMSSNMVNSVNGQTGAVTGIATATEVDALESRIDNIVAPSGDPSLTEVSDARVGADSTVYSTLKGRIDGEVSELNERLDSEIDDVKNAIIATTGYSNLFIENTWISGEYVDLNGVIGTDSTYKRSAYIPIDPTFDKLYVESSGTGTYINYFNAWYDSNKQFISLFTVPRNDNATLTPPSNARYFIVSCKTYVTMNYHLVFKSLKDYFDAETTNNVILYAPDEWEVGGIYTSGGGNNDDNKYTIRTPNDSKFSVTHELYFFNANPLIYNINAIKYSDASPYSFIGIADKVDGMPKLEPGYLYRLVASTSTSTIITTETLSTYADKAFIASKLQAQLMAEVYTDENASNGYSVNTDFTETKLTTTNIGTLSGHQAFLVKDDYYYSTTGSMIYKQDSSFNVVDSASINIGHGNTLQLANDGYAYSFGWNDNTIYKVDLSTLTVVDTISIPTTGYTSGVVDPLNKIAYIFQRSDYPDTVGAWQFIKYDYNGQQILNQITIEPFSAIQGCSLYSGKIIVTYGMGTSACPSGIKVYDTTGTVLCEYMLDVIATREPECVCYYARKLYLLLSTGALYKVEQS